MTTETVKKWTVNEIKAANRAAGFHWFDPDTIRFHRSRILPGVWSGPGGVFFVSQDAAGFDDAAGREYNVRRFSPGTGGVGKADGTEGMRDRHDAEALAARLAFGGDAAARVEYAEEDYKPVRIVEQFAGECRKHGNPEATENDCTRLIHLHRRYHELAERECNAGGAIWKNDGETITPLAKSLQTQIRDIAAGLGATSIEIGGDPRGCVVKLVWPDGATNDFGREGWCVPTSTREEE
jgi:hypothetical protein